MRIVAWNCNMALPRKFEALLSLRPDIAIISECANPDILTEKGIPDLTDKTCQWMGRNANKGLGVFAFNGFSLRRADPFFPTLRYMLPVHVSGPRSFNLLAAWAQNASGGATRKHQLGPLRRAITKYRDFLSAEHAFVAGDLNNNAIWDRPGWRINHMTKVEKLRELGLVSAYHAAHDEEHGKETTPTHYWRNRTKDGPTYHLDYIFMPERDLHRMRSCEVGSFEDWCGTKLSDHAPISIELA